jgi:hypothetical protein
VATTITINEQNGRKSVSTISNGRPPKDVATVILHSITKESPEHKKNSTDEEFEKMIVANLLK